MRVDLGPEIIRSYKRLSYTPWHAIAEFVDNATQSYHDHSESLEPFFAESEHRLKVSIKYRQVDGGKLVITDNAMGMSEQELSDALRIGRVPENTTGLSEFGMGLKTAACWFGNRWSVKTKQLGSKVGNCITFDVEEVASGNFELSHASFEAAEDQHFTTITITELNRFPHGAGIARLKRFLSSMYRNMIRDEGFLLSFNSEPLQWRSPADEGNIHVADGKQWIEKFEFDINNKQVHGWMAILEKGSRSEAGLTIMRRGRVIKGWPESWRPQSIFGQFEGSNDLVNQRLVGEVNLDGFGVSHTKDDILWENDEETLLEDALADFAEPFVITARSYRKRGVRGKSPSDSLVKSALNVMDEEITSSGFRRLIASNGQLPVAGYEITARSLDSLINADADAVYEVAGLTLSVYLSKASSSRNPYLGIQITADDNLNVVINMNHPHVKDLSGRIGVLNHLKTCTYEGVAQWKVQNTWGQHNPELIRVIKDSLLRIGSTIDDD